MTITPSLFEAHLKCPTKCWLRAVGESASGNLYAKWVHTGQESYRTGAANRLMAGTTADDCAPSPGSSRREETHPSVEDLKGARWLFAVDVLVRLEPRSSRGDEAQTSSFPPAIHDAKGIDKSLLTSAATNVEPRRRRPRRLRDKREKYHHSLQALAIREKKIHIVGSPELKIEGTPVYLDVDSHFDLVKSLEWFQRGSRIDITSNR